MYWQAAMEERGPLVRRRGLLLVSTPSAVRFVGPEAGPQPAVTPSVVFNVDGHTPKRKNEPARSRPDGQLLDSPPFFVPRPPRRTECRQATNRRRRTEPESPESRSPEGR